MLSKRERLIDHYRALFGPITVVQIHGLSYLLRRVEQDARLSNNLNLCAYILATAKHGSAHTFEPAGEFADETFCERHYGPKTALGKLLGNKSKRDAEKFTSRGYSELAGRKHYARAAKELGVAFLQKPELALEQAHAYEIMVRGMLSGWFGPPISTFIKSNAPPDFEGARQSVTGHHDRAESVAQDARRFLEIFRAGA